MRKRSYQHPRNEAGQFQKQCGCSIHVENPEEKSEIFKTSSINRKKGYKIFVDEGLIDRRASYVCNVCLNFMPGQSKTKEKVSDQSSKSNDSNMDIDSDITEEESINLIKKICQNLKHCEWDQLSVKMKESIYQLQFCLGQIIGKNLYNDRLTISKEYRDSQIKICRT